MGTKKLAAAVGAVALGGAALLAPSMASAQSADGPDRPGVLASVLQDLVEDGTLEQAQADAVADRLQAALPPGGMHRGGPGHGAGHPGGRGPGLAGPAAVAEALGMTVQELREARSDGDTLAEIAAAKDISREDLVDRLVAAAEARLDEAVTDERLTAEQAQDRKDGLEQRISDLVDREPRGPGRGHGAGHGAGQGPMHD